MRRRLLIFALLLLAVAAVTVPAWAQDANGLTGLQTQVNSILSRLGVVEQKNEEQDTRLAELERRLAALEQPTPAPPPPPPSPSPGPLTLLAPAEGATVTEAVPVRVTAPSTTTWIGVHACGGQSIGEDHVPTEGVWEVVWDTRLCPNGETRIEVWAYNDAGIEQDYAHRNVTVSNATLPPPAPPPPPPPAPVPSEDPAPIAGQGYSQRFADDFDTFDRSVWTDRIWYDTAAPAPGAIAAADGVLTLTASRSQGYRNVAVTTLGARSFTYGYFEARMRWTGGAGSWPAFWLISERHATNPAWPSVNPWCAQNGRPAAECWSAELDVMEGQGREPTVLYGSIHRNSCGCYGAANEQNANNWQPLSKVLAGQWHDYGMLWTPNEIRWYVDGEFTHSAPTFDSTSQPQFLLLQMWTGGWTGGTTAVTPDELRTEVDRVAVWQK